ncbi:MAG: hypothetical protein PWQ63_1273, partial [Methanolobus sp.]|nr:hypothetical protein [Methanolobus sp.]
IVSPDCLNHLMNLAVQTIIIIIIMKIVYKLCYLLKSVFRDYLTFTDHIIYLLQYILLMNIMCLYNSKFSIKCMFDCFLIVQSRQRAQNDFVLYIPLRRFSHWQI